MDILYIYMDIHCIYNCQRVNKNVFLKSHDKNIVGTGWWRAPGFSPRIKHYGHSQALLGEEYVEIIIFILSISDPFYQ